MLLYLIIINYRIIIALELIKKRFLKMFNWRTLLHGTDAIVRWPWRQGLELSSIFLVVHRVDDEECRNERDELHKSKDNGGYADTMNVSQEKVLKLLIAAVPVNSPQLDICRCIKATLMIGPFSCIWGAVEWLATRGWDAHLIRPGVDVIPTGG